MCFPIMTHNPCRKLPGLLLLLALAWPGCGLSNQELRNELQDDRRSAMENLARGEKSYEQREYFGLTSRDSEHWNSTDWSLWMDSQGGH